MGSNTRTSAYAKYVLDKSGNPNIAAPKKLDRVTAQFILSEEQTLLSKQRTMLSFIQTGLGFIGMGLVVAKFFGDLIYELVGILLIIIGFYEIGRAYKKLAEYNRRLERVKAMIRESNMGEVEYGPNCGQG